MDHYAAMAFGIVFISVLSYAGMRGRPITDPGQFFLLRAVAALSAAGVAAFIPGFINLQLSPAAGIAISAGGAIAVFLVVYLLNPPELLLKPSAAYRKRR